MNAPLSIPLAQATFCVQCESFSNDTGETCSTCGGRGGLMSASRVLQSSPPSARLIDPVVEFSRWASWVELDAIRETLNHARELGDDGEENQWP